MKEKLTEEEIKIIKSMGKTLSFEEIAKKTGINKKKLNRIIELMKEKGLICEIERFD
jgi:DNA-binding IscR family transcriptional regulator